MQPERCRYLQLSSQGYLGTLKYPIVYEYIETAKT